MTLASSTSGASRDAAETLLGPRGSRRVTWQTLVAIALIAIVGLAQLFGVFEVLDLRATDFAFFLRGRRQPESPVVILAIDEESFRQSGYQWPWPRSYIARIISAVAAQKPAAIVLDIFFYEEASNPADDHALAEAMLKAGNVILADDINVVDTGGYKFEQLRQPIPSLVSTAAALGLANVERDTDGFVRRLLIYKSFQGEVQYSWAAQAVAHYLGLPLPADPQPHGFNLGDRLVRLNQHYLIVNFDGPKYSFPQTYSAYQALTGEIPVSLTGKIVLLGAYDESLHDTYPTPFEGARRPMPGVEINAHAIDTILSERYLDRWPPLFNALAALLLGAVGFGLSRTRRVSLSLGLAVGLAGLTLVVWFGAFLAFGLELGLTGGVVALAVGYVVPTVERAITEERERRRLKSTFERFVPPAVIDDLLEHEAQSALRGRRTELTVLFSDIRGFTTLSEQITPEEVVAILNEYLGAMTELIFKYGGTVDKYEGDAILAFWGAPFANPDDPRRAVRAAYEMRLALARLRDKWGRPGFDIGIGLNTGEAFVGTIGSLKRLNYTCIGDTVNLSSRIQNLTKDLRAPVLLSDSTYERVKDEFVAEYRDSRARSGASERIRQGPPRSHRGHGHSPAGCISSQSNARPSGRGSRLSGRVSIGLAVRFIRKARRV
ncbi:MAG: adenylate/guanylate cyclase domain-containing protein [Chloroflexi bacterium]|nr:adenylate/guanylate cyclase domain-containing protein [Chloroflexota bacterium]